MWRSNPTTTDYIVHTDVICCGTSVSLLRAVWNILQWDNVIPLYFWPLGWESRCLYVLPDRRPCDLLHVMSAITSNTIYFSTLSHLGTEKINHLGHLYMCRDKFNICVLSVYYVFNISNVPWNI